MDSNEKFHFWYAVNNTEVIVCPERKLESFGTTTINYHLVTDMMDTVDKVRVREGNIHAFRPEIMTPTGFVESLLEGFGEEQAEEYMSWLRQHEQNLVILKYGFKIRKEALSEQIVNDSADVVVERIKGEIESKPHNMGALIRGVDEPWEVCLLKLMVELVQQSSGVNVSQLRKDPHGHHNEISQAFHAATKNPARIQDLANLLQEKKLFGEYEDRFFSLVRASQRGR